jgi:hypothetical protein
MRSLQNGSAGSSGLPDQRPWPASAQRLAPAGTGIGNVQQGTLVIYLIRAQRLVSANFFWMLGTHDTLESGTTDFLRFLHTTFGGGLNTCSIRSHSSSLPSCPSRSSW